MMARTVKCVAHSHSRQRAHAFEVFDRGMDLRERLSCRHGTSAPFSFGYGVGERAEIERRSMLDVCAPSRN